MAVRSVLLAVFASATIFASVAEAQGAMRLKDITAMLQSDNADEVQMALEAAAVYGKPKVVPLVVARAEAGLPPALLSVALDVLALLGRDDAAPLFTRLARHRRRSVRIKALIGLVAVRAPGAEQVLKDALGDMDETVRAAAANGLGELGATGSKETLYLAFDRGVLPAAGAIGKLATTADLDRIADYMGKVPFTQVRPMLDGILGRDKVDVKVKLRVITMLEELATLDAKSYLTEFAGAQDPGKLRNAAQEAAARISLQ